MFETTMSNVYTLNVQRVKRFYGKIFDKHWT